MSAHPGTLNETGGGVREPSLLAKLDTIGAMALAWRLHAERLRAAISWVERPFADEATPDAELRQRITFMIDDTARSDAILSDALDAADTSGANDPLREDPLLPPEEPDQKEIHDVG